MKKRMLSIVLALGMAASLTACGSSDASSDENSAVAEGSEVSAESESGEKRHVVLGVSMADASDPNIQMVEESMEKMLPEFEEKYDCTAELIFTNAAYSVDTQIADVESLIEQECDAISIRSVDTTTDTAFEKCNEAGIPVLDTWFGTQTDKADSVLFVIDNYYIGELEAQWVIDYAESTGETLYVGNLDGISGAADTLRRTEAFVDTVNEKYNGAEDAPVQILATQVTENNTQTTLEIVEDWMQTYPEMNCIIGYGDDVAMAAVNALKAANKSMDDFVVVGVDGTTWIDSVPDEIDATVKMDFEEMARLEMEILFKLAYGEDASGYDEVDRSNIFVVDASNVDEYR